MTTFKKQIQRHRILYWAMLTFWVALVTAYGTLSSAWAASGNERVVVIDPGHGGYDPGGGTKPGAYEKEVTLKLAMAVVEALRPDYRAVLTRTGDYHLELTRRSAIANRQRADLFISLHLGGSRQQHVNIWAIYSFGNHPETTGRRQGDADDPVQKADSEEQEGILWRDLQPRHANAGKTLAGHLKSRLQTDPRIPEVVIHQAPLRVLQGVDAPAVVLEAGYLTNPGARETLNDPDFVSDLANHIRQAVDAYFQTEN